MKSFESQFLYTKMPLGIYVSLEKGQGCVRQKVKEVDAEEYGDYMSVSALKP